MTFRKEKGRHEAVTSDGKIIRFDDADEMLAFAKLRKELNAFVGRSEPMEIDDSVREIFLPTKEEDVILANASVGEVEKSKPVRHIKNVRIFIDPDVEYLGNEKALA